MTGDDVAAIRRALRLDVATFSGVLGASTSAVYRWEATGEGPVKIDPHQLRLLVLSQQQVQRLGAEIAGLGARIEAGVLTGGSLYGLYILLGAAFDNGRITGRARGASHDRQAGSTSAPCRGRRPVRRSTRG